MESRALRFPPRSGAHWSRCCAPRQPARLWISGLCEDVITRQACAARGPGSSAPAPAANSPFELTAFLGLGRSRRGWGGLVFNLATRRAFHWRKPARTSRLRQLRAPPGAPRTERYCAGFMNAKRVTSSAPPGARTAKPGVGAQQMVPRSGESVFFLKDSGAFERVSPLSHGTLHDFAIALSGSSRRRRGNAGS